jgi:hypothetical protein
MADGPDVQGMVSDPQFQSLAPADKRAALSSLTGDQSFAKLSDADTMRFVSTLGGTKATVATESQAALNPPKAPLPNVKMKSGMDLPPELEGKQVMGAPIMPPFASLPQAIGAIGGGVFGGKAGEYVADKTNLTKNEHVWARDIGSLLGGMAGAGSGAGAESMWQSIKSSLADKLYTPEGKLTPVADAIAHPTKMPEVALRKIIPPPQPEGAGAPLPSSAEFYENRAADLAKRTGDVKTEGQQSGGFGGPMPSASEFYEQKAEALAKRPDALTQAVKEGRAARLPVRIPKSSVPQQSPFAGLSSSSPQDVQRMPLAQIPSAVGDTTTTTGPQVQIQTPGIPRAAASKIIQPGSPQETPPSIKGSFWSYPEGELRKAVLAGDREAAVIYRMRYNTLPEGAKYLNDVTESVIKGLYKSRK